MPEALSGTWSTEFLSVTHFLKVHALAIVLFFYLLMLSVDL